MSTPHIEITLYRQDGDSITLDATGAHGAELVLIQGVQGLGAAPPSYSAAPRLAGNGSLLRGRRLDEREFFLPFLIDTNSPAAFNAWLERITRLVSPLDPAPLMLRVKPLGRDDYREIQVHYAGGLENTGDAYHGDWASIGLELKSFDALWSGQPEVIQQQVNAGQKPFLSETSPFFPVILAESVIQGQISIEVQGDSPTWPMWTITPPGTDLTIAHLNTSERFQLLGLMTEPVTINMRTGQLISDSKPNGELWDSVPPDKGALFQLNPGFNQMKFAMVGATVDSMLYIEYRPQYLRGH